jgi:glutamate-1-semialdehyde 2,1-aminomutase
MMTIHPGVRGEVRSPADIAGVKPKQRDLLQLDLIARGIYIANRGMVNLSLPMTEAEFALLVGAFEEYLDARAPVIG